MKELNAENARKQIWGLESSPLWKDASENNVTLNL
jgi:hypothetical protein